MIYNHVSLAKISIDILWHNLYSFQCLPSGWTTTIIGIPITPNISQTSKELIVDMPLLLFSIWKIISLLHTSKISKKFTTSIFQERDIYLIVHRWWTAAMWCHMSNGGVILPAILLYDMNVILSLWKTEFSGNWCHCDEVIRQLLRTSITQEPP